MRRARLLPATFPDAIGPGEYQHVGDRVAVACPKCGVVCGHDVRLRFACGNCDAAPVWFELAGAN